MSDEQILPKSKTKKNKNRVREGASPRGDVCSSTSLPSFDMYRGYFPLWRKITDWGWYKDSKTKSVFIHLLLKANREKKDYLGNTIYSGQCVTGRKQLSAELGLSERQVRTALRHLKATNEIAINATNKFSIITLNNYKKYLPKEYYNFKKTTSEKSSNRPATDQQPTTTNKDNKDNKDNNSNRGVIDRNYYLQIWNKKTKETPLPALKTITGTRWKHLKERLKEKDFTDNFSQIVDSIIQSDFLSGKKPSKTHPNFKADFDWLIKNDTNYIKILEGKYKEDKPKRRSKWEKI